MTSYYDRTGSLMRWCREQRLPAADAYGILLQRFRQAEEYMRWVAGDSGQDFSNPQLTEPILTAEWRMFLPMAEAIKVQTAGRTFWEIVADVYTRLATCETQGGLTPCDIYETDYQFGQIWDVSGTPFGILHSVGHRLKNYGRGGGYSDSPYPYCARGKGRRAIRDSDEWLRERYPTAPAY